MQTSQPLPPKDPPSLGRLARRISRWTTNSLLTVMLLVIALGFGREVLHWWHDDAGPRPSANAGSSAAPPGAADSQAMAFGNQDWSIRRQEFSGSQAGLPAALVAFCRSWIADALPRGDAADDAEQDVLKRLAGENPVAEEPGHWRLYEWSAGCPIVVGVMRMQAAEGTRSVPATLRTNLAEPPYRVVIWGMAVPAADPLRGCPEAWTLYVFHPGGTGSGTAQVPRLSRFRRAAAGWRRSAGRMEARSRRLRRTTTWAGRPGSFMIAGLPSAAGRRRTPGGRSPPVGRPALRRRRRARGRLTYGSASIRRANRRD